MMPDMLSALLEVTKKAGQVAVAKQEGIEAVSKADKSPVTAVDLLLSEMIRSAIKPFTDLPNHMFVDEEVEQAPAEQWKAFNKAEYAWFIDPIAGTQVYMNGLPFYAISVGVLKEGRPHVGAVYLPALDEMYWHENGKAFFKQGDKKTEELTDRAQQITPFSIFYINMHQRFTLSEKLCRTAAFPAVNPGLLWSAKGKFVGALVRLKVWDMAAAWGVCNATGLDFYDMENGKKIETVSEIDFDETWKMRRPMIMTSARNCEALRQNITTITEPVLR